VSEAGRSPDSGYGRGLALAGDYAFIRATPAPGEYYFQVWSVADPADPELVSYIDVPDIGPDLALYGDYVFLALDQEGLMIVDISDPENPQARNLYDMPGNVLVLPCRADMPMQAA